MTARLPFTQQSVRRAIAAARKEGLRVTEIRPDGTLVVQDGDAPVAPLETQEHNDRASRWAEVKA
jgi:hypothetical protein